MLVVKTSIKASIIEGIGLFAEESIPMGTTVWKYDPRFDLSFEPTNVDALPELQKDFIKRYAYLSSDSGKYIFCADDARFMNHSSTNNNLDVVPFKGEPETRGVANRDIKAGEEILINYRTFDSVDATSQEAYLSN